MAFIPIDAKADIQGSKKGKLTPAQHAQLNTYFLTNKTGILDCLGKCEATAGIYSIVNDEATVVFNKGYVVVYGRIVECEAGTSVTINTKNMPQGKIVLRFDLASNKENEVFVTTKNGTLDKEDLNENPITGKYDFVLYEYSTSGSSLILKDRTEQYVLDVGKTIEEFEKRVDERLKVLGFSEGAVSFLDITNANSTLNKVSKNGKYSLLELDVSFNDISIINNNYDNSATVTNFILGELPEEFTPNTTVSTTCEWFGTFYHGSLGGEDKEIRGICDFYISANRKIYIQDIDYIFHNIGGMPNVYKFTISKIKAKNIGFIVK